MRATAKYWTVFTAGAALYALGAMPASASVEVSSKPTQNMSCTSGVCTPTAKKAVLNVADLTTMLANGDTTVKTNVTAQDVEIDAALSWGSAHKLILDSYHSIAFNRPVKASNGGGLTVTTNDGADGGNYRFFGKGAVRFGNLNSSLIINSAQFTLVNGIRQIEKLAHTTQGAQYVALARNIDASGYADGTLPFGFAAFEGLGNAISNLTIHSSADNANVGLFDKVTGTIRDLNILNADIAGTGEGAGVGGIAGVVLQGSILYCSVTGRISADGSLATAGGLAGANEGAIIGAHSDASVSLASNGASLGGLVGWNFSEDRSQSNESIADSYATGAVTGGDNVDIGGLVGFNRGGTISNSYSAGQVSGGMSDYIGGLAGENYGSGASIYSSYATGAISGGSGALVGGLIGRDDVQAGISNSYWDLDTSGISDPSQGAGNVPNDPGITGLSDAQLKSGLPSGFDKKVWKQSSDINNGYPYLIDNPPPK